MDEHSTIKKRLVHELLEECCVGQLSLVIDSARHFYVVVGMDNFDVHQLNVWWHLHLEFPFDMFSLYSIVVRYCSNE